MLNRSKKRGRFLWRHLESQIRKVESNMTGHTTTIYGYISVEFIKVHPGRYCIVLQTIFSGSTK